MSIQSITIEELRRMEGQEGLILQGCFGSVRDWKAGINMMLSANGCLKYGTEFTEVRIFEKDGNTCLLFPFTEGVKLNMEKLDTWCSRSNERYGSTRLTDYVENSLGGFIREEPKQVKPDCPYIGKNPNILDLIGLASRTLRENQMEEQAMEMRTRVEQSRSYHAAVSIIGEYVNITPLVHQEQQNEHQMGGM